MIKSQILKFMDQAKTQKSDYIEHETVFFQQIKSH